MPPIDRSGGAVRHKTGAQWTHRIPLDAIHSLNATKVPGSGPDWNSDPPVQPYGFIVPGPCVQPYGEVRGGGGEGFHSTPLSDSLPNRFAGKNRAPSSIRCMVLKYFQNTPKRLSYRVGILWKYFGNTSRTLPNAYNIGWTYFGNTWKYFQDTPKRL